MVKIQAERALKKAQEEAEQRAREEEERKRKEEEEEKRRQQELKVGAETTVSDSQEGQKAADSMVCWFLASSLMFQLGHCDCFFLLHHISLICSQCWYDFMQHEVYVVYRN